MRQIEPPFELEFEGIRVQVAEHEIGGKRVFHIDFKGLKKALTITVARSRNDEKFWTSVPQGRQQEAEQIGRLVANQIRSKKR